MSTLQTNSGLAVLTLFVFGVFGLIVASKGKTKPWLKLGEVCWWSAFISSVSAVVWTVWVVGF